MGFLDPYRVLDLTDERGLLAGRMLADLGADVIQVEPPAGSSARRVAPFVETGTGEPGGSLYWDAYARNKRGITLDLDTGEGQELFRRLCATADFLFESEQPGTMARRSLSFEDLHEINPHLIYTSITPFGAEGPKANYADSELICWAAGAALYQNRDGDRPPVRISVPQAYLHASADAAGGALIAHSARVHTGRGQRVDISAQRSVAQSTLSRILAAAVGDHYIQVGRSGATPTLDGKKVMDQSGSGSQTGSTKYRVKDGFIELHISVGPAAGQFTNNLMAWMLEEGCDDPLARLDWREMPRLVADGEVEESALGRMRERIGRFVAPKAKRQLLEASLSRKLLIAPIYTTEDLAESPHLAARSFFVDVEGAEGRRRRLPGPFARTSRPAFVFRRAAPCLGEHNGEVYRELLGLGPRELAELKERGIL